MAGEYQPVAYVPQPFAGERYRDTQGYGRTLADLIARRGQTEAAIALQRGDAQARLWQGAGGAIAGAVDDWQRRVLQNRAMEMEAAQQRRADATAGVQLEAANLSLKRAKRQEAGEQFTRQILPLARREDGIATYDRGVITREFEAAGFADMLPDVLSRLDEQDAAHLSALQARKDAVAGDAMRLLQSGADAQAFAGLVEYWEQNDAVPRHEIEALKRLGGDPKTREQALMAAVQSSPKYAAMLKEMRTAAAPDLQVVAPGSSVIDKRNPKAGALFTAPAEAKDPTNIEGAILQAQQRGDAAEVDRLVGIKERIARAGRSVTPAAAEPLVPIVGEDGRPVLVPRSQAVGKQPASTREQGRQVTSGDAGDIAEFNTALDDLASLRGELEGNGATGTAASLGASLWTPITNLTGWGADAKAKQAQIDRVKQVIGKALEGGVLRKEDEAKYEKILPTIKDAPALVTAKLNGLVAAIQKRQQRKLDALDSAGYDVSRFGAPGAARPSADGWQEIDGIRVRVKP